MGVAAKAQVHASLRVKRKELGAVGEQQRKGPLALLRQAVERLQQGCLCVGLLQGALVGQSAQKDALPTALDKEAGIVQQDGAGLLYCAADFAAPARAQLVVSGDKKSGRNAAKLRDQTGDGLDVKTPAVDGVAREHDIVGAKLSHPAHQPVLIFSKGFAVQIRKVYDDSAVKGGRQAPAFK